MLAGCLGIVLPVAVLTRALGVECLGSLLPAEDSMERWPVWVTKLCSTLQWVWPEGEKSIVLWVDCIFLMLVGLTIVALSLPVRAWDKSPKAQRGISGRWTVILVMAMVTFPRSVEAAPDSQSSSNLSSDASDMDPIRVDVASTIPDAEWFPTWIRDRNPKLEARFPDAPEHQQWISVKLRGATYDYRVRVVAMRNGEPVGVVPDEVSCECNSETLLEVIDQGIAEAIEQLEGVSAEGNGVYRPEEPEPESASSSVPVAEATQIKHQNSSSKKDRQRGLSPLGYSGIGLGVLGMGALATGIPLSRRGPDRNRMVSDELHQRSMRIPGVAMAVAGSVALTAGVILVVVDVIRRRSHAATALAAVRPHFSGFGFEFRG